jgi:hypothetical protein
MMTKHLPFFDARTIQSSVLVTVARKEIEKLHLDLRKSLAAFS